MQSDSLGLYASLEIRKGMVRACTGEEVLNYLQRVLRPTYASLEIRKGMRKFLTICIVCLSLYASLETMMGMRKFLTICIVCLSLYASLETRMGMG